MCYVSLLYRYFYPSINSNKNSNEIAYTAQSFTMVCKKVWCTKNLVYTRTREVSLSSPQGILQAYKTRGGRERADSLREVFEWFYRRILVNMLDQNENLESNASLV